MPFQNRKEVGLFTVLASGMMIYAMDVYNTSIGTGGLSYAAFAPKAGPFFLEWALGYLCAFFLANRFAQRMTRRLTRPDDRPMAKILCTQVFTVCIMAPFMSLVGSILTSGLTPQLPLIWLQTLVLNFPMALALQIFATGPICRKLFSLLCPLLPWRKKQLSRQKNQAS